MPPSTPSLNWSAHPEATFWEGFGRRRWKIAARCVALLLLASAVAKAVAQPERQASNPILDEFPFISTLAVQFEVSLAVLLVWGIVPVVAWWLACLSFAALCAVSLGSALLGFSSCGCFGEISISPFVTFAMDAAVFGLLAWARPAGAASSEKVAGFVRAGGRPGVWCGCNALVFCLALLVVGYGNDLVVAAGSQRALLADPSRWKGLEFPLLPYVDVSSRLREGRWKAIVFRRGCAKCESLLRQVAHEQRDQSQDVAVIEVPPYAVGFKADRSFLYGRLSDIERWRLRTPLTVQLIDGRVASIE